MRYPEPTHVALYVPDLRVAESYYCDLLDLEVAWRDTDSPTSMFASWEQIDAAGAEPVGIMLGRNKFRLALARLETEGTPSSDQSISQIGLQVSGEQLRTLRERARAGGLEVLGSRGDELFTFRDAYGVQWELDTRSFDDSTEIGRQVEERRQ